MTPAERAVRRIREEMDARKITQRELAKRMQCSQSRITKLLNGDVDLRVNDAADLATAVGLALVEAIRDRGLEFYAELSPLEVRALNAYRNRRPDEQQAMLILLGIGAPATAAPQRKAGRPRNSAR